MLTLARKCRARLLCARTTLSLPGAGDGFTDHQSQNWHTEKAAGASDKARKSTPVTPHRALVYRSRIAEILKANEGP